MTVTKKANSLVIVGATGMVGGYALRYALDHPAVGVVTAIGRKPTGLTHPKLNEVLHQDFADCSALAGALSRQDAAVFCLGAYTGAVADAELHRITVDYTIEFARVLSGSSPNATFAFLSAAGADPTGRSRISYVRYKGEAEKHCPRQDFPTCTSFAPRTSTLCSRAGNPMSAIACCARSIPHFGRCFPAGFIATGPPSGARLARADVPCQRMRQRVTKRRALCRSEADYFGKAMNFDSKARPRD